MSKSAKIEVSKLNLDLKNYRTVPQKNEVDAIKAMISINANKFYGVMESIITDGYLPTENIILLEENSKYTVMEGNRRIACLKIIHGLIDAKKFSIREDLLSSIKKLSDEWKNENLQVPCSIYKPSEKNTIDKIISLAHGKGELAARDKWASIATARHNREVNKVQEPALDLLEKYLKHGQNANGLQKERWAGDYNLTVLDEGLRHLFARLGYKSVADLVKDYPKTKYASDLENLMYDVGVQEVHTRDFRNETEKYVTKYGAKPLPQATQSTSNNTQANSNSGNSNSSSNAAGGGANTGTSQSTSNNSSATATAQAKKGTAKATPKSYAINDPREVVGTLKKFKPKTGRPKVVTLKNELITLSITKNPIAFCFLLRSAFEISAKLYCDENGISLKTIPKAGSGKKPSDKSLADLLRDVNKHLTNNNKDQIKVKVLHGATTEITRAEGILSVRSMNQLVHNEKFSVQPSDICTLFGNVFPLLEAMNI
ncbi:MAG: hypothetical protein JNJ40_19640 [Bacteroidia bacterium]|nr:hypothetical protein [Bacteroidia bacterium]